MGIQKTKIIIVPEETTRGGSLDLANDIPFVLNYSLANITDIQKRNTSFSKTIILPGTNNNRRLLGQLFDVNIEFNQTTFDINKKTKAYIYQDDMLILEGYLKLTSVNILSPSDISNEQQINFEAVVFGSQGKFFDVIKERFLSDINLDEYTHSLNWNEIVQSSGHTWLDGYKYINHYTLENKYKVSEFRPSIYVRTILSRICQEAGFDYVFAGSGDFIDMFNKLLVPTANKKLVIPVEEQLCRSAKAGISTDYFDWASETSTITEYYVNPLSSNGIYSTYPMNMKTGYDIYDTTPPSYNSATLFPFDDTSGGWYEGCYNPFQNTTHSFRAKKTGKYDITTNISGKYEVILPGASSMFIDPNNEYKPRMSFVVSVWVKNGVTGVYTELSNSYKEVFLDEIYPATLQSDGRMGWSAGTYSIDFSLVTQPIITTLNDNLPYTGDEVEIRVRARFERTTLSVISNRSQFYQVSLIFNGGTNGGLYDKDFFRVQAIRENIGENDIIDISDCLPPNTKQVDFIQSLVKMFNLYIDVDRTNNNRIVFTPRVDYYDTDPTQVRNWEDKLDYSKEYSIDLLSELQTKTLDFTYQEGKDLANTDYFSKTNYIYGEYKINFENDFLKGETKIQPMFEPTPLVANTGLLDVSVSGNSMIVPFLQWGQDSKPKILIDGGVIYTDTNFKLYGWTCPYNGSDEYPGYGYGYSIGQYNYAGHFDNPYNPLIDINYATNEYYLYNDYDNEEITNDNLFNHYWSSYVNLISNSRLFTGYFNIEAIDIQFLDFSKLYFFDNNYWLLNSVVDYNALEPGLTKCTFIKSIATPVFAKTINPVKPLKPTKPTKPWLDPIKDPNSTPITTGNVNDGTISKVDGSNNTISKAATNIDVTGDLNYVGQAAESVTIKGTNNNVGGNTRTILIVGNDNKVGAGATNVTLINCTGVVVQDGLSNVFLQNVSNQTITNSAIANINEWVYFNEGMRINNSDVVDGGEDIIFLLDNPYPDNQIDGQLDDIMDVGVDGAQLLNGTFDSTTY